MGNYLSTTSLSVLLPGFLKSNTTTGDGEGVLIAQHHIDRAENKINGALALRYSTPFTTVPPLIITLTEDIMTFNLMRATGFRQGQLNEYEAEFKSANETLSKIAGGEIPLIITNGTLVPIKTSARFLSSSENHELIMNLDDPKNWALNETETDDIADTRD